MSNSSAINLGVFHTWTSTSSSQKLPRNSIGESIRTDRDRDRESAQDKNRRLLKQAFVSRNHKFLTTNGQLRHGQPLAIVPYPLSYDREWLEMDELDHAALWSARSGPSDFNFQEFPERCLDLGCGTGNTARVWKTTKFVGFDLMPIQPDLSLFPEIADRIQWVKGNFLHKLPFDDKSFDHVYARSLEMAIPENKWDFVLSELARVLKPGGAVEFLFNDIIFPYIPLTPEEQSRIHSAPVNHQLWAAAAAPPPDPIAPDVQSMDATSPERRVPGRRFSSRARKALSRFTLGHDRHKSVSGQLNTSALQTDEVSDTLTQVRSRAASVKTSSTGSTSSSGSSDSSVRRTASTSEPTLPRATSPVPPVPPLPSAFPLGLSSPPALQSREDTPLKHIHVWLEELFYAVFERRFINLNPTRIVPIYLQIYLKEFTSGNPLRMQLPAAGTIYAGLEEIDSITDVDDEASTPRVAGPSLTDLKPSAPSLILNTNVSPPTFNPLSTVSSAISASPSFLLHDSTHLQSETLTPATSYSRSHSSSSSPGFPPISTSGGGSNKTKTAVDLQGQVTLGTHVPTEHAAKSKPTEDIPCRSRASSSVFSRKSRDSRDGFGWSIQQEATTAKPPPPLKCIMATQALTIMLVKQLQMVMSCRETMFEELLIQHDLSTSEKSLEPAAMKGITTLREKFDHAFDHYVSDMRTHAAVADGLVYTLGFKRPLKARLTPTQEFTQKTERERQMVKTLSLIGKAFRANQGESKNSIDSKRQHRQQGGNATPGDEPPSERNTLPYFRSTRVYAGFTPTTIPTTTQTIPNNV
ncbi:hypothetical protein FRB97_004448 [Tulasnella sp. 331]|nr:hypothetical protein FRB97_004448 [Tulasnella sp. 331]